MRREEVAWAARISFDYYVKLEQGRMLNPSPSVLNSIIKALRLSALDRRYLSLLFEEEAPFEARTDERDRHNARATLDEVASHFPEATMRHILDRDLNLVLPDAASKAVLFPGNASAPSELSLWITCFLVSTGSIAGRSMWTGAIKQQRSSGWCT